MLGVTGYIIRSSPKVNCVDNIEQCSYKDNDVDNIIDIYRYDLASELSELNIYFEDKNIDSINTLFWYFIGIYFAKPPFRDIPKDYG